MTLWSDNWNNIIRNVIFKDDTLLDLMKIPKKTSIIEFIDRYFIHAGFTNKTLTDESVRIIYSDSMDSQLDYKVARQNLSFDIYVKIEDLHNVENDRLVFRTNRIAERLIYLLTHERYVEGYRFWTIGSWDMGTSTVGYARYNVSFQYIKTY